MVDEVQRVGRAGGVLDRGARCARLASIRDVRRDAVVEQHRFLADVGDLIAQAGERQFAHVDTVEQDGATPDLVETRHQRGDRRLAAARRTDQRGGGARCYREGHPAQGIVPGTRITKRHVDERQVALHAVDDPLPGIRFGFLVDQVEYALGTGQSALQWLVHTDQALDRRKQQTECREERDEGAHGHRLVSHLPGAEIDQDRHHQRGDRLDQRFAGAVRDLGLELITPDPVGLLQESSQLEITTAEHLDHLVPAHRLTQHVGDLAHRGLGTTAQHPQALGKQAHREDQHREQHEHQQRELPVEIQHVADQPDHDDRVTHQDHQHLGGRCRHLGHVVRDLRDDQATRMRIVVAGRQAQDALEHSAAQIQYQLAGDPRERRLAREVAAAAYQEQHQQQNRRPEQELRVAFDEGAIQQRLQKIGYSRLGQCEQHHEDDPGRKLFPIRAYMMQQSAIQLPAAHLPVGNLLRHARPPQKMRSTRYRRRQPVQGCNLLRAASPPNILRYPCAKP